MEPGENKTDSSQPVETPEEDNELNPIGRTWIALILGICIVLLLNTLNRGGWFALLSALFGMLFYIALVLWQWLLHQKAGRKKTPHNLVGEGPEARRAAIAALGQGLLIYGFQAIIGFVGLLLLPDQQSTVFALISGVLGFLVCKGLFTVGMFVLVAFIGYKQHIFPSKG